MNPARASRRVVLGVVLLVAAIGGFWTAPAGATEDDAFGEIVGALEYRDVENERVPVAEVTIRLLDDSGSELTATTTAEDGSFAFTELTAGAYLASIDVEGLPDGVNLRDPSRTELSLTVDGGRTTRALFALVSGDVETDSGGGGIDGRRVAQLTVEGLKLGLYLAMAAIGLSLIFGTTGLTNFAHAEMVTFGMMGTYFFNFYGLAGAIGFMSAWPAPLGDGVNLIIAAVFGLIAGGILGFLIDRLIFKPCRRAGVGLISQMVISIGLSMFLRYAILYTFGGGPRTFLHYSAQRAWEIGPIDLTPKDALAMTISVVVLVMVGVLLQGTRIGTAMRAVADNRDLAESSGIDVQRVISYVWISGGALAALGGVFFGLDQIKWDFGFRILLLIFASVVLGGLGTAYGALVGALVVGLAINLSTLWIDAELKNMVALLILIGVLVVRPQGILGAKERIG